MLSHKSKSNKHIKVKAMMDFGNSRLSPLISLALITTAALGRFKVSAAGCPNGWVLHAQSCYLASHTYTTYAGAEESCSTSQQGAHLVAINSQEEQDFIAQTIKTSGPSSTVLGNVWIGLWRSQPPTERCNSTEDTACVARSRQAWQWPDGTKAEKFVNWAYGQPDGEAQCGRMVVNGNWRDIPCSAEQRYICELPLLGPTTSVITSTHSLPSSTTKSTTRSTSTSTAPSESTFPVTTSTPRQALSTSPDLATSVPSAGHSPSTTGYGPDVGPGATTSETDPSTTSKAGGNGGKGGSDNDVDPMETSQNDGNLVEANLLPYICIGAAVGVLVLLAINVLFIMALRRKRREDQDKKIKLEEGALADDNNLSLRHPNVMNGDVTLTKASETNGVITPSHVKGHRENSYVGKEETMLGNNTMTDKSSRVSDNFESFEDNIDQGTTSPTGAGDEGSGIYESPLDLMSSDDNQGINPIVSENRKSDNRSDDDKLDTEDPCKVTDEESFLPAHHLAIRASTLLRSTPPGSPTEGSPTVEGSKDTKIVPEVSMPLYSIPSRENASRQSITSEGEQGDHGEEGQANKIPEAPPFMPAEKKVTIYNVTPVTPATPNPDDDLYDVIKEGEDDDKVNEEDEVLSDIDLEEKHPNKKEGYGVVMRKKKIVRPAISHLNHDLYDS